jgi:3',5'-cyclic AMP phosphodiesterase CpdA
MHRLENGGAVDATGLHVTAAAMKDFCRRRLPCDWAVMLGDHIYPRGATAGADGVADELRFAKLLTGPLAGLGADHAGFRIYSVLGNHDWYTSRAGAMSQVRFLESHPPFYMDGIRYAVQPPSGAGRVELFALDTYVLLAGAGVLEDRLNPDGSEMKHDTPKHFKPWVVPTTDEERTMVEWLERSLRESRADWKIVFGHHPIWSSGGTKFEEARVLRRLILPILCRYADAYIAGHDHTLEVHTDDCSGAGTELNIAPLVQVISGAASKQRGINRYFVEYQNRSYPGHRALFARGMTWGFAHITLYAESAELLLLDTEGGAPVEIFRTGFARRSGAAGLAAME